MCSFDTLHNAIQARIDMADKLHGGDPLLQWEIITERFSADIPHTIRFILTEMSDTELYWLSEVFDELLLNTKSRELLDALKTRTASVQDSESRKEIADELDEAIGVVGMF